MKAIGSSILVGAVALALGVAAWAGGGEPNGKTERNRMTEQEVRAKVEEQGYKIRRMEREHDGYEVKAEDASGRRVELEVSAAADGSLIVNEDD